MRRTILMLLFVTSSATAQDSTFSSLHLRLSGFRNPAIGHIADDWRAGTGIQIEIATPVAIGELGVAVGRLGYTATTGKPDYTGTLFTIAWMSPAVAVSRLQFTGGVRFTDYRMDFDDPSIVVGLRTEEEVLLGVVGRVRAPLTDRVSVFADGSVGVLMLGTRTRVVLLNAGIERTVKTPEWIRSILR